MPVPTSSTQDGASSSSAAAVVTSPPLPPLTSALQALSACRFSSWYPPLKKVSPKATILDVTAIQPDFFQWLEEDGLVLPRGSGAGVVGGENQDDQLSQGDGDDEDDTEEDDEGSLIARDFSALDERIRQVIEKYDGQVFPKLDWSAPRDAAWILPGQTMQCSTPADVYLLLKSSDFVAKDLTQLEELRTSAPSSSAMTSEASSIEEATHSPLSLATASLAPSSQSNLSASLQLNLILKRHFAVAPSHEFRCFVRGGQFIAIAQRDGTYYDFLQPQETRRAIRLQLLDFWQTNLKDRLCLEEEDDDHTLQDYIWDAYLTRDRSRVFLMDVNPYLPRTDALLWDWDELETRADKSWRRQHGEREGGRSTASPSAVQVAANGTAPGDEEEGQEEEEEEDELTGESSDDDDEDIDPRGEPFVRIYTDGRPPTTHYRPYSPTSNPRPVPRDRSSNGSHGQARRHRLLPPLRLLTSQNQSSGNAGHYPRYSHNMIPKDVVDVSSGRGISEFARVWRGEVEKAEESSSSDEE